MSIYQNLYNLINQYIFGGSANTLSNADLVCTLVATIGVIFLISIPFIIVYKVINIIVG